jgi:hypothetical protein
MPLIPLIEIEMARIASAYLAFASEPQLEVPPFVGSKRVHFRFGGGWTPGVLRFRRAIPGACVDGVEVGVETDRGPVRDVFFWRPPHFERQGWPGTDDHHCVRLPAQAPIGTGSPCLELALGDEATLPRVLQFLSTRSFTPGQTLRLLDDPDWAWKSLFLNGSLHDLLHDVSLFDRCGERRDETMLLFLLSKLGQACVITADMAAWFAAIEWGKPLDSLLAEWCDGSLTGVLGGLDDASRQRRRAVCDALLAGRFAAETNAEPTRRYVTAG